MPVNIPFHFYEQIVLLRIFVRKVIYDRFVSWFLAGYAGGATTAMTVNERTIDFKSDGERAAVLDPSSSTILRGALRGFG